MTIVPMYKTCPVCGRKFSWNPDVGKWRCPYCKSKTIWRTILGKFHVVKKKQ